MADFFSNLSKLDYDRYICSIFARAKNRSAISGVYMFNIEIAKVKNKVSEPSLGMIRYKWWEDAIEEIYDENRPVRKSQNVLLLQSVINEYPNINKQYFLDIIEARAGDLEQYPFENIEDLLEYLDKTTYSLNLVIADILQIDDEAILSASKKFVQAWGITAIMRSANKNFGNNRVVLPLDLMNKAKLNKDNYGGTKFIENSKIVIEDLHDVASNLIASAREDLKSVKEKSQLKKASPILLYGLLAEYILKQIKKSGFNVFTSKITSTLNLTYLIKFYYARLTSKY